VVVAGATGYIGRAVVHELVQRGYRVVALVRQLAADPVLQGALSGAELRTCDVADREAVTNRGIRGESFDAMVSCIASRSGARADAWDVDYRANQELLAVARAANIPHFILLSAICVQKPLLEFQKAKLAFESELVASGLSYSIVRPTAYFKSLAGQVERVRRGKRFTVFGDGELTACKPISQADLASFIADCVGNSDKPNRVLEIGGPGPALTPLQQGEMLFAAAGRTPKYRRVSVALMDRVIAVLDRLGRWFPGLAEKAELARIGRYYATESMLHWDESRHCYDADATPEYGGDTLADFYRRVIDEGMAGQELGAHAVFDRRARGD
jgi:divinyl chlorophyllide a 8-vinyl-reductase